MSPYLISVSMNIKPCDPDQLRTPHPSAPDWIEKQLFLLRQPIRADSDPATVLVERIEHFKVTRKQTDRN